jgi:hypothetical protein
MVACVPPYRLVGFAVSTWASFHALAPRSGRLEVRTLPPQAPTTQKELVGQENETIQRFRGSKLVTVQRDGLVVARVVVRSHRWAAPRHSLVEGQATRAGGGAATLGDEGDQLAAPASGLVDVARFQFSKCEAPVCATSEAKQKRIVGQ